MTPCRCDAYELFHFLFRTILACFPAFRKKKTLRPCPHFSLIQKETKYNTIIIITISIFYDFRWNHFFRGESTFFPAPGPLVLGGAACWHSLTPVQSCSFSSTTVCFFFFFLFFRFRHSRSTMKSTVLTSLSRTHTFHTHTRRSRLGNLL